MKRGTLLKWMGAAAVGTVLIEAFFLAKIPIPYSMAVASSVSICIFALVVSAFVAFSNIFAGMKVRSRRADFLMLPASKCEKYLCAFIFCSLIWPIASLVAFAVGDSLRMLFGAIVWKYDMISALPALFDAITAKSNDSINLNMGKTFAIMSLIWNHSLYIACGTWMKKIPFIVATAIGFAVLMVFSYLSVKYFFDRETASFPNSDLLGYSSITFFIVMSVVNYCASYYKFKNFEVVSGKWFN